MFEGLPTGRKDCIGIEIRCGDKVSYYQFKKGYIDTYSRDGVRLCHCQQHEVPDREKTITGVVVYDPSCTGFVVMFDDYMLDSGMKEEDLYMLLNAKYSRKLLVLQ